MKRLGLGVSKVDWTTTFDFVCKGTCSSAGASGRRYSGTPAKTLSLKEYGCKTLLKSLVSKKRGERSGGAPRGYMYIMIHEEEFS